MRLIDADALKSKINLNLSGVIMQIDEAPTIEAEPVRHGRWEWRGGIPWCSNCGEMPPGYSYEGEVNTTPYCPSCGAIMGKEG